MRQLMLKPQLHHFNKCKEFVEEFKPGKGDLIITNAYIFDPYFGKTCEGADILYQEKYGRGEPSDEMAQAICDDIKGKDYKRIIAIGGGTVCDLAKIYALKNIDPILDLYNRKLDPIEKGRELVLIPTTCGTGSEVTNIAILAITATQSKLGLAVDEMYADHAVLIPELLGTLPYDFFATSSIDALIHAVESSVSPKATPYTLLLGYKAIEMIIKGYQEIQKNGKDARLPLLSDFLIASNYAGIAFGNAGVGAVHAMSYPLSGKYHVAHGEANYTLFIQVFRHYFAAAQDGAIAPLNEHMAGILGCPVSQVYEKLAELLEAIIPLKPLSHYGVTEEDIEPFTQNVMEKQGRLTANNYVPFDHDEVAAIYRELL